MNDIDFDWDAIRVFLAVAENESLSRAAETLALSQPTVGRHIARLEDRLGVQLFDRRQTGYVLTEGGIRLIKVARSMARGAADFKRAVDFEKAGHVEQVCRITLGEWGQHFLSRHVPVLVEGLGNIRIELYADDTFWDLTRNSADIAVGNLPPTQSHLIAQKLGERGFYAYASSAYLRKHADAYDPASWSNQVWAGYCGARAKLRSSRLLADILDGKPSRYAVNNSRALLDILRTGEAMGILPDWIGESEDLHRLNAKPLGLGNSWMSFHERLRLHPDLAKVKNRIAALYRQRYAETSQSLQRPNNPK
ncbi:LysR family transcriptional regulator [uncultured Roseibium sp.]|uniref:LysR family transcriptional regulator n=1 Tax=uncultured Roseibium sp. TaxID=1936171 RepID=UPI0026124830|nr:LysR family transcriptional regulator [uncultured Roseibium sp.]